MSFLKKLFGGSGESKRPAFDPIEHEGYSIRPEPMPEGGQFRLCAVITKEVGGEVREHRLIRADVFPSVEQAAEFAISKSKQMIEEQGERLFN